MKLGDVYTGALSWRRLKNLIKHLPREAHSVRAQHGEMWGRIEHQLADITELLQGANWQRSGGRGPKPKPVWRPGQKRGVQYGGTDLSPEQVKELLRSYDPPAIGA